MNETKSTARGARSTASLKRKATAASLGVLLGAFAVIAASAQQNPSAGPVSSLSTISAPAATAGFSTGAAQPSSESSATGAPSEEQSLSASSTTVAPASHARTRQS